MRARLEELRPIYLASFHLGTPDPALSWFEGEQLVVRWKLLPESLSGVQGRAWLRFCDYSVCELSFPVLGRQGYWRYRLLADEYFCKGGILSYKIEIGNDENVIASTRHHLWADIIDVNASCSSCS